MEDGRTRPAKLRLSNQVHDFINTVPFPTVAQALVPAASTLVSTLAPRLKNTSAYFMKRRTKLFLRGA
ncbi:hypothetical protein SBA4_670002 [Candidatus Sulfopaludibacter sp. SbA4]|nr:hypothetical protein SBA4_670002 [Candidatus Sulfopaludibacter sp. SbA4]